jgi:hypothetical protein
MTLIVVPAIHDLKKKSSGGGGFSDGGVLCKRLALSAQSTEVGPPPGIAWCGFNAAGVELDPSSVQAINFDPVIPVSVTEYFVFEDGSEQATGPAIALTAALGNVSFDASDNVDAAKSCSPFLDSGGVLAYPNKLRYRLSLGYQAQTLPTKKVLLHFDVAEFDLPSDQA